jgi:hypothetical protein
MSGKTIHGRITRALALISLMLAPALAPAGPGQFYFVARVGPEGSMTAGGQDRQVVYLRWDLLEGRLPPDLVSIRLLRGTDTLLDQPVGAVMSAAEIAALYQGPAQARRLQESVTLLREIAAQSGDGSSFPASAFPAELAARLDPALQPPASAWAEFGGRFDFNVARARYRGYVDEPGAGRFSYELLGVNSAGDTQRLGKVEVDTRVAVQLVGPRGLAQLHDYRAACDLPEAAKDHHTVALTWDTAGGDNLADRFAAQVYLAGYDVYRSTHAVAADVSAASLARDIAQEAAAADFDERGGPLIPRLVRINDIPVTDPGGSVQQPKWLETMADLQRAGIRAGERYAYYLVARDFTGNYGPTVHTVVEVPDLTRPAAPWRVRAFADQIGAAQRAGENLTLRWDAVNLENYLGAFGDTRRACNTFQAAQSGVLEYVGLDEDCNTATRRRVRLDVAGYLVYRFADFDTAERFRDSDGDGVADFLERPAGLQCDPGAQPGGAASQLVWPARIDTLAMDSSGREVVRFQDQAPAADKGGVYWYRVASYTSEGRLSVLSPPVRGLFPDRELPPPPAVSAQRPGLEPDGCRAEVRRLEGAWEFGVDFNDADRPFALACGSRTFTGVTRSTLGELDSVCKQVQVDCAGLPVSISYPAVADTGGKGCLATVPAEVNFCESGEVRLRPDYAAGTVPAETGITVAGPLEIVATTSVSGACVSLFQDIDGEQVRVGTSCGTSTPGRVAHSVPAGYFCGYAVTQDASNNISAPAETPCVLVLGTVTPPGMPQLLDFSVSDNAAQVRWRLPLEPLAAVLVRLEHEPAEGPTVRRILAVPVAGRGAGEPVSHNTLVSELAGERDRWCVSLRAVGVHGADQAGSASDWTPQRCVTRSDVFEPPPVYLPWPAVAGPVERAPLPAFSYVSVLELWGVIPGDQSDENRDRLLVAAPRILASAAAAALEDPALLIMQPVPAIELGRVEGLGRAGCRADLAEAVGYPPLPAVECSDGGRLRATAALESALGFLVYRQWRRPDGTAGDWQQASPLIEFAHWDPIDGDGKTEVQVRLNDPWIRLVRADDAIDTWRVLFFDRYPVVLPFVSSEGREYRYQLVYFDDRHRPVAWRQTDWIGVGQ